MAEEEAEQVGIEKQIEHAICTRLQHFKDQADSLTLESVRRLLEKDLGLEKFALDAHKRFVRQYLEKKMDGTDDYSSKTETENVDKDLNPIKEEASTSPKSHEMKNNLKKSSTGDEEMMEDSPIMGVLTPKSEADTQGSSVNESKIKKAICDRADHFLANSENITLAGVRRLLEEDLGLAKNTLDPFKKFISLEIDQVLNPPKGAKSAKVVKKKTSELSKSKKSKEISKEESGSSGKESDEMEEKVKSKDATSQRKVKKLEQTKKRKIAESEMDTSRKESKSTKRKKEDNDSGAEGSLSEDGQSPSSVEKPAKKKEKPTPGYGKRVEHLKSIIKACGMSVAPTIYKKAKQVPDSKREAFLVKELEAILSREGLSNDPTEKEIRNCRKKKETARELEGIDMSNIISSSRRRSTFSFVAPVNPEVHAKKNKAGAKGSKTKDASDNEEEENEDKEVDTKDRDEGKEDEKKEKEDKVGEGDDDEAEEEDDAADEEDDDDEEEEEEDDEDSDEFNEDDNEDSD